MRGHTLLEALVCSGLMLLALVLCGQLAVAGMRTKLTTEDKNQTFRAATIVLDEMNRQLLSADRVLLPNLSGFGTDVSPPLVIRQAGSPPTVVGYIWDRGERTISRVLYAPTFNAAAPSTHTPLFPPRVVATRIEDFTLRALDPRVTHGTPTVQVDFQVATQEKEQTSPTLRLSTWSRLRYKR